jgi:hypothetical protein
MSKYMKVQYKAIVLHENMTPKELSNIEDLLNTKRHYFNQLPMKISDTQSLLLLEYSVPYFSEDTEEL